MIIKKLNNTDVEALIHIAEKTFHAAYAHLSKPEDFNAYATVAFSRETLLTELNHPDSAFYFAMANDEPAGYLKLNYNKVQPGFKSQHGMEVERLYVLPDYQGQQIGQALLQFAVETANSKNLKYAWLGVWEINHKAIKFYEKNGFNITGRYTFPFGDEKDADLLMRRELP